MDEDKHVHTHIIQMYSCIYVYAYILNQLNHRTTNTGLGSTTSAPRGGDIGDKEREVRAGRSQGSRPSGHARTTEEARWCTHISISVMLTEDEGDSDD